MFYIKWYMICSDLHYVICMCFDFKDTQIKLEREMDKQLCL